MSAPFGAHGPARMLRTQAAHEVLDHRPNGLQPPDGGAFLTGQSEELAAWARAG